MKYHTRTTAVYDTSTYSFYVDKSYSERSLFVRAAFLSGCGIVVPIARACVNHNHYCPKSGCPNDGCCSVGHCARRNCWVPGSFFFFPTGTCARPQLAATAVIIKLNHGESPSSVSLHSLPATAVLRYLVAQQAVPVVIVGGGGGSGVVCWLVS